jgi:putative copper resistance protein D
LVLVGLVVAAFVAAGLTAVSGARPVESLGLPDPGALTTYGLPAVRTVTEIAAVLTVGALLLAAFLVPAERSGYLDVTGYQALRSASYTAGAWIVGALLMVPLTVADSLGRPLPDVLGFQRLIAVVPQLDVATAWAETSVIAVVVFAGCRLALSWGSAVLLLAAALAGLIPVAATGHSSAGGAHDVATDSLIVHVVAASLWVGGLVALLGVAGRRSGAGSDPLPTAVRRFSALALVCWLAMAVSGVLNAAVRIPLGAVFGSYYGALLLAKTAALLVLGGLGHLQRRHAVAAAVSGRGRPLLRLGSVEVLIMLATVGLAVALGRTAAPPGSLSPPSKTEVVIGYDLAGPPTAVRLLFDWRFDLLFGTASLVAAWAYLWGVRRLARRGDRWPRHRTASWLLGCAVLLLSTSSGIGRYAPAMFSVHMAEHMALNMFAPILLMLGAPVTLALRTLPSGGRDGPPGPREWLLAGLHSPPARLLSHPLVALPLFVGSYYALYFSGLFQAAMPSHLGHLLMLTHFLVTGLLFFWLVIGVDPAPRRLSPMARLGVLLASVPFHAFFGVILMGSHQVIARGYYAGLALPWVPDLLADQKLGGGLAWSLGEVPLLVVVISVVRQWSRIDERSARRADRRAELDQDADLAAYNAMLRQMASGGARPEPEPEVRPEGTGEAQAGGGPAESIRPSTTT